MPDITQELQTEIKALKDEVSKGFDDKIKALDEKAEKRWNELKATPDAVIGESLKSILDDRLDTADKKSAAIEKALTERMDEIETKAKERAGVGYEDPDQLMAKAIDGFTFKPRQKNETAELTLPLKAVTTISNANANGAGFANRQPGIMQYPQRPLYVRDLLMPGSIDGFYYKYERELAGSQEGGPDYQGGTGTAAEGATKPTMDIYTEMVTAEVATIAVTSRVSQQVFDDRAAFISFLRGRMGYLVNKKLDEELMNGSGDSGEIEGINTIATAYNDAHVGEVTAVQALDLIRFAKLQVTLQNYIPDTAVIDPTEWASMETLKDADERYLIGDPRTGNAFRGSVGSLWGMNVVATQAQTADAFTVGDSNASQVFMRQELSVLASTEDQDNFVKNLVTLRAELRALLANYSTLAWVTGDFSDAIAAV